MIMGAFDMDAFDTGAFVIDGHRARPQIDPAIDSAAVPILCSRKRRRHFSLGARTAVEFSITVPDPTGLIA